MNPAPGASVRVSAPVRLDFAGAWTDVAPFADRERGIVVNAAIELRTHVDIRPGQSRYQLVSDDLAETIGADRAEDLVLDGRLDLVKAAIRSSRCPPCAVRTTAAAPAGSGLGSSGALGVALVAAFEVLRSGRPMDEVIASPAALAEAAWRLETADAGIAGGKQDQYAAALGGFQRLSFERGSVRAEQLALDPGFAAELAAHTLLCFTGRSRFSGSTISRVMQAYETGDERVTSALRALAEIADAMADAMLRSDLVGVGRLLAANWAEQQHLDAGMSTPEMEQLEGAMRCAGAIGGKAAGAGAGGSMFFIVPGRADHAIAAATGGGATILPVTWAGRGVAPC